MNKVLKGLLVFILVLSLVAPTAFATETNSSFDVSLFTSLSENDIVRMMNNGEIPDHVVYEHFINVKANDLDYVQEKFDTYFEENLHQGTLEDNIVIFFEDNSFIEVTFSEVILSEQVLSDGVIQQNKSLSTTYTGQNWFGLTLWSSTLEQSFTVTNGKISWYADLPEFNFTSENILNVWTISDKTRDNQGWNNGGIYAYGEAQVKWGLESYPVQEGTLKHKLYISSDGKKGIGSGSNFDM